MHYENNNPFLVVTSLSRTIEVSMWGNIAVEEVVDIRHSGAKLDGAFSRYEFQRENSGIASVKSFKTILPASGRGQTHVNYPTDSLTFCLTLQPLMCTTATTSATFRPLPCAPWRIPWSSIL